MPCYVPRRFIGKQHILLACLTVWDTQFLQLISQKGATMVPTTQAEVRLYYNKSHTFKYLVNARFAELTFQCRYIYTKKKKKEKEKYPPREWTL